MVDKRFNEVIEKQITYCSALLQSKGREYAGKQVDRLAAFKKAAILQGTTPTRALLGYAAKHITSLYDFSLRPDGTVTMGSWEEKITDTINYLLLLKAVLVEKEEE